MEQKQSSEYISIPEYARRRNVSAAAVYKRLDGTLKPFLKVIDGKKFLSVDALEFDGIQPVENGIQPPLKTQEHNRQEPGCQDIPQDGNSMAWKALDALERQLAEKDRQISRLQEEAAELRQAAADKDKFIQEQSSRLALLLEQSQELQRNNQILLGAAQGMKTEQRSPQEAQGAAQAAEPNESQGEAPGENRTDRKSHTGFWKRLFGRE